MSQTDKAFQAAEDATNQATAAAEETVSRIRDMNERIIEGSRNAGIASLDAYEKALENLVQLQEQTAGASQLDWVNALAQAHAKYVQDVSKAYTDAARDLLNTPLGGAAAPKGGAKKK
ncbi:putative membrane protein [Kineosphaera limosa]|uniref:Phasin domain-containing protein n=1 Tax=Kineosphaera limosa NBRC 100340 TaxID=1184609 RepID=K6VKC5_9MICO|nr:hypothetical protein [Kineosphaera limosa]NYE01521.1 putative membrane protein [Kineosphaera limosa]GAB96678.1 hypothetical protein KILIM_045_00090 [Kineosphaera limosa NBRC 100340]